MEPKNSNEDSNYINENQIKGHGNPITLKQLKDMIEKGENSMVKIETIEGIATGSLESVSDYTKENLDLQFIVNRKVKINTHN